MAPETNNEWLDFTTCKLCNTKYENNTHCPDCTACGYKNNNCKNLDCLKIQTTWGE